MAHGISALDPRVAATEKFIQDKNIPPDQVENFLLSMGADPRLASLVFKYRKVREASENASKGPPPTSNVDQDISNQYAQLKQQRMQGIAGMPAPAIAQAPMMGGITGQAPPQQMAGGGVVGYDFGGFITAPKTTPSNPQNPLGDYTPDPNVQRQINDQAGLGEMSEADKFRFYGMPMEQAQRPSDSAMFGSALKNVATDPAAIGAGIGGILGGPLGIPVGGYLGRTVGKVTGMADGGIVAFAGGGGTPRPPRVYEVDPEGNVDIGSAGALIPYAEEVVQSPSKMAALRRAASRGLGALAAFPVKHPLMTAALAGGAYMLGSGDDDKKKQTAAGAKVEEMPQGMSAEDIKLLAGIDAGQSKSETAGAALPAAPKYKRPSLAEFDTAISEVKAQTPKDRKAAFAEEMDRLKEIGAFEGIEARRKELAGQKEKAVTSPEKKFWLAFAQAGFTASAKGARNLWETLSMGGVEGMKAYQAMKDKEAETLEKIADKELQLNELMVAKKTGAMEKGDKRIEDATKELRNLRLQKTAQEVAITNAENTNAAANWRTLYTDAGATNRANIMASRSANKQKLQDQYYADIAAAQRTTDPALKAALLRRAKNTLDANAELERTRSGYQTAEAKLARMPDLSVIAGQGGDGFGGMSEE